MEIQGRQAGEPRPTHQVYEEEQRALIDANRARVRAAREDLGVIAQERLARLRAARQQGLQTSRETQASERRDAIELSAAARAAHESQNSGPAQREARVRELAEAHRMERLHTPERIERAAERLLEG